MIISAPSILNRPATHIKRREIEPRYILQSSDWLISYFFQGICSTQIYLKIIFQDSFLVLSSNLSGLFVEYELGFKLILNYDELFLVFPIPFSWYSRGPEHYLLIFSEFGASPDLELNSIIATFEKGRLLYIYMI